ncbi:rho GTPase-activating protein 20-like [Amphiprion ocellaris]|uniref:Rho-GAP domain-containing protein n=1 Tax=Amphiprion ocellaris TaxID=80972 RepID=A0A3Q1C122_AMPOC|nr:rho GTPase-activating protein 20-like [Amphiprion ocellaris]XP_035808867.2 rho GTPase-activating protein 20-like [Amphiprion ocellaris]XP_054864129.1 rho GTPase-activating protein 20-like [Amphiprion ocellaris]
MADMSPQQQQDSLSRGGGQQENKRRMKTQSYRRQSAPSLVISKALIRSKTLSRESFLVPVSPETCPLVQSFLTDSDRSFLLHGHAQLKTGMQTQDRHLFLFNDILVIAKAKSANHFKQKAQVCVCEMWTAGCMDEVCEGSTNPESSFVMGWPTCNCVATFSSAEQKEKWLSLLKSRIKEEKEKEEPKTIPLRVYGKGINTFAITKTLPVSNSDSTNEVIRLALQQFGIIGNVKDFQLWVISKRDTTPYPLIGHEFPFSIQMSHVRVSQAGGGGRDAAAAPADREKTMQVEQLQGSKQCQFILKPRPVESLQQHVSADLPQKSFKRRRSLITWAFWRGSSSHLNELSLAGAARGCLFSQPLSSVCVEDALPKPVMDMLAFLYHEGSWTRGIFRRPAGARAVRELRDSLDGGEVQLPLTRDHVFIIAGVFKDFLRSIPGSLLCCELHEDWMEALEEDDVEEEQVQDIQRMIGRLPKQNALLLRYLLAVLHGIQGNAQENQMTSFNLSVCIAPSMLWPPGAPCSPEVEGEGTKKVCELVKFMIEHCQQILREDPSSLFGGPPQRVNSEETGSESWVYPLTDSSYNSLENELDNSSGGSPGFCSRTGLRSKPLQGSLDSILTFSDYDQDTDPDARRKQKLHPRGRRRRQELDLSCSTRDQPMVDASSTLDSLSLEGRHTQRRRSEPAIAYVAKFQPCPSGSTDGLTGEDEDGEEEVSQKTSRHTPTLPHCRGQSRRPAGESGVNGGRSAALEASSSSLSSTPASPAPTRSSLDSLDSLSNDQTWATRRGLHPNKTPPPSNSRYTSIPSTFFTSTEHPDRGAPAKDSPPKEPLSWGTLKGCRGLHPNSWLKKDRRLSLTQQDNLEKEEEDKTGGGAADKSLTLGKLIPDRGRSGEKGTAKPISSSQAKSNTSSRGSSDARGRPHRPPKHDSSSPPSHHRSTGSLHYSKSTCFHSPQALITVRQLNSNPPADSSSQRRAAHSEAAEQKQPSPSLFYRHSGPSLSLFKRQKSHSVEGEFNCRLYQRRGSEPGRQVVDRASTLTRARLPSDPGLKVSQVEPQGGTSEARFCLSPHATKTVRDYFSSHLRSNPQSSQQVALALVEGRREWLKRCSDPSAEPDFDQLLFAEESYV